MTELALSQPWHTTSGLGTAEQTQPWASLPDHQLVALTLNGRPDAYGELVRRHQTSVYNIAYRLAGDRQEALDLAQEAFVRAFTALASFDRQRPFGPWIGRIATNVTLNWLQRLQVLTVPLAREPLDERVEAQQLPDFSTEPERVYLAGELQAQLRQAIVALPPRYRAVIELRHFQECSYAEIAEVLHLPISDVKSDLFRARRLLRSLLAEPA
jgi:RNA polymerase sigma-70 factor (ECF subfamily)